MKVEAGWSSALANSSIFTKNPNQQKPHPYIVKAVENWMLLKGLSLCLSFKYKCSVIYLSIYVMTLYWITWNIFRICYTIISLYFSIKKNTLNLCKISQFNRQTQPKHIFYTYRPKIIMIHWSTINLSKKMVTTMKSHAVY